MKTVASKLPEQLADRVDDFADDRDLNRSQAIRTLLEHGLDAQNHRETPAYVIALGTLGLVYLVGSLVTIRPTEIAAPAGAICLLAALLLWHDTTRQKLGALRRDAAERVRSTFNR
ncbi:hypothetical protein J2754_003291 [Halarchaeum solikamskense]|uniref:CopG family ribbon-helix-helix protein n=1 Tax=Halarchaeum nitratireducens TaxID=489913 RepID=UPI001B3AB3DC|nr:ribbon-helix-helix protein, CopG family [Halarchaeum solikamskense]MBP2252928.1 hypothetical protein [Halarchaeum solikamskense]